MKVVENFQRHGQVEVIHHPYQGKDERSMPIIFHFAYNPVSFSMVLSLLTVIFLITLIFILFVFLLFLLGNRMGRRFPFRGLGQILRHGLMSQQIDFIVARTLID